MRRRRTQVAVLLSLIVIVALATGCLRMIAAKNFPPGEYEVQKVRTVMVPMRDGTKLATDIYLPKAEGPFPVILERSPYGKGGGNALIGKLFAGQGYAFVVQDVRGRYASEGHWYPFTAEGRDGQDTFNWVAKQGWCNGKIGLWGVSYFGYTEWQVANGAGSELKAFTPIFTASRIYEAAWREGVFNNLTAGLWGFENRGRTAREGFPYKPGRTFKPPLDTQDARAGGAIPFYRDWIKHPTFDSYWRPISSFDHWFNINAPALMVGGWYDLFLGSTLGDWKQMTTKAGPRAREDSRLVIGPWAHGGAHKLGGVDFGASADFLKFSKIYFTWFDHYLRGKDVDLPARVTLFTTGTNEWHNYNDWPPANAERRAWYLHSGGQANGQGDGELNRQTPTNEQADRFTHDPANLVPTIGGPNLLPNMSGPYDASANGRRNDVLTFTSGALANDTEFTGPVEAEIYLSADTPDVDLMVTLLDVEPSGAARVLTDGVVRARYRNGDDPTWLNDNEPTKLKIDMWALSHVFKRGHRVQIHIAASNYPRYAPNPCTRADPGSTSTFVKSHIRIYHDAEHASRILVFER